MKNLILIALIVLVGCSNDFQNSNSFTSQDDTLILKSTKTKGDGLYYSGGSYTDFMDSLEWKKNEYFKEYTFNKLKLPENIKEIELGFLMLMFDTLKYYNIETNKIIHQTNLMPNNQVIPFIKGLNDTTEVFVIDENDNLDLTDDELRYFSEFESVTDDELILCKYNIEKDFKQCVDSGWKRVGKNDKGIICDGTSQHLNVVLRVDGKQYQIAVNDENSNSFSFFRPIMYLVEEEGHKYDSLLMKNIVNVGEFIKLGEQYYKFHKLYNGCGTIVLIKEANFDKLVGTQVGMKTPEFNCMRLNEDTINVLNLYKEKPLLIANISACFEESYELIKDLAQKCNGDLNILVLNYGDDFSKANNIVDVRNEYNIDVYNLFRKSYSSYDCYLIGTNGRILDKFDIFDWEVNLSKYIN